MLKDNIVKIGQHKGYNLYMWTWNKFMPLKEMIGKSSAGVLAQEVLQKQPELISIDDSGFYKVNYGGLNG